MADPEHLEILKRGAEVWNEWRNKHVDVRPDLRDAQLRGSDLSWANLCKSDLRRADLSRVDFRGADLRESDLSGANLSESLFGDTDLSGAQIFHTNLNRADLSNANFSDVDLAFSSFGDNDLRHVIRLETVNHRAPSHLSIDTINNSGGNIPEAFLRGCGLSDWQIEHVKLYRPKLSYEEISNILDRIHDLRAHQPTQIGPLFISYNHADGPFVDELEVYLNERGVRFWRDVPHSTAGRLEKQINRAMRLNRTVLLVLSEHSVRSDWVEHEARLARKLEQETDRDVLCPIALDDTWKTCRWPERLREQIMEYNVLDFSSWQNPDSMRRMFSRLIEGLNLFYK
jgi:hypothetical protein